jgi:hypothetical protein
MWTELIQFMHQTHKINLYTAKFGSNDARQIDYVVPNDGPRVGSYTVFYCDNLTVIVGQHCTTKGKAMTQKCRELIEATYSCVQNQ